MTTRRLRWQGPARARACEAALQGRLRKWLGDWSASAATEDVDVAATAAAFPEGGRGYARTGGQLWLAIDAAALGARLAGLPAPDGHGLATRLGMRALDDLAARLLPPSGEAMRSLPAPDADDLAPRFGSLGFAVAGLGDFRLVLDLAACDALVPPATTARPALSPRVGALGAETLRCDVVLGLGDVALTDASALAVGEVLLAGPLRDAVVQVRSNGSPILEGALSRQGERLAVAMHSRIS